MEDDARRELAIAIAGLYDVIEGLVEMLDDRKGVNTPIQIVGSKLHQAKRRSADSLRRLAKSAEENS